MYVDFPHLVGFGGMPVWWALPILGVAGLLVALTISRLPGTGGHEAADGFIPGGAPTPPELPGVCSRRWRPWRWAPCSGRRRR